ncbi:CapA family protein [Enterococcus sp. AZ109]|uniref:CapA family protein n=1 Tax=Enterococcus sp. AZ109 TaxID=2774634 RepID=UPI003F24C076
MKKWLAGIALVLVLAGCSGNNEAEEGTSKASNKAEESDSQPVEISFSAVGDNLIHDYIYEKNQNADGTYNFDYMYEPTRYLTSDADISYINLETICGGEELGLSGYPSFNGPTEILDAVNNAGFNWLAAASNHTMDRGEAGIVNQLTYLEKNYPDTMVTGSQKSAKEDRLKVQNINGVKVGFTTYTYGLNGYTIPEGKDYLVNLIDEDLIKKDMKELNKISDVQVVSMHWGQEYQFVQDEEQEQLAQMLSDAGVDVIVGGHPHVIQPVDYVTGSGGNETLVIYSLGNFLSSQAESDQMLGGMARWKINYDKTTDEVSFKDVAFWPTITYIGDNYQTYEVYALKDYTNKLANQHMIHVYGGQDMSREYFIERVNEIMNDKVELVY